MHSTEELEWLAMLELTGWPSRVGAWVGDASWMREGHYAAVEVDDTSGAVNGDPKSCPESVYLIDIVRVGWEISAV